MLRKVLLIFVLAVVVFSFAGCQTIQGVGKDITWMGGGGNPARK